MAASSKSTIIIISDDIHLAAKFKAALQQDGFDTTIYSDPNIALHDIKLNPERYSVVLIDYVSQLKKSTDSFPKEVKELNEQIKMILLSGFYFNESNISRKGYDGFFQLPISLSRLVTAVRTTLASERSLHPMFN